MQSYPSLFAYLNRQADPSTHLQPRDRPILELPQASERADDLLLIPLSAGLYEVAFPHLKPEDLEDPLDRPAAQQLQQSRSISLCDGSQQTLYLSDEVLDRHAMTEAQLDEWEPYLDQNDAVSQSLLILTGLFSFAAGKQATLELRLMDLLNWLRDFEPEVASQPLIISLEQEFQLQKKLEQIAPHLRTQLRRQAEPMPVGRIQEMDAYCLRDYIRRPGSTAAEKAGARQELMGIQRHQDYNTAENKFLKHFAAKVLHLECTLYLNSSGQYGTQVSQLKQQIDRLGQQPEMQQIQAEHYHLTRPNYVLQQNPIYSSFYRAFLKYLQHQSEQEYLWACRNHLLIDAVYLWLLAAISQWQGAYTQPSEALTRRSSPDYGRYLANQDSSRQPAVKIFLRDRLYELSVTQATVGENRLAQSDLVLTAKVHDLHSRTVEPPQTQTLLLWIFWYRPTAEALLQADRFLQSLAEPATNLSRDIM